MQIIWQGKDNDSHVKYTLTEEKLIIEKKRMFGRMEETEIWLASITSITLKHEGMGALLGKGTIHCWTTGGMPEFEMKVNEAKKVKQLLSEQVEKQRAAGRPLMSRLFGAGK